MAASLLRIGRLGCHKCLQAGSWSTLSRAPVAVAFTTKSGGSKKSSQKRTFDKKQAKTYFDIEKLVQHKLCEVSPATAAETAAAAAAKPTAQPMPSGSSSESVAITSAVETGGIVVEASFSPQGVSDPASAAEATPVVEVPPAVEALFESATTAGAVPVVEAAESATVVAAVPIVEGVAETAASTPTEDLAVATVTATETTASVGKEPDEVARLPATDAGAALVVEIVLVEATPIDVAPEPVAEAAPVEVAPEPVAEAAPVEAAPEPVAEVAPFVAATAAVLVEATPVDVATLEPVAEAATVEAAPEPAAGAAPVNASLEPEAKAVMGPVAEPVAEAAPVEVAKAAPLEVAPEPVAEAAPVEVAKAAPLEVAPEPVAEAAPVEAAPEPIKAPYTPLERAEELVDHAPVLTKATGEELQEEIPAEPAEPSEAHMDPIQKLFLESIRKYSSRSQATGGLVDAGSDYEKALAEEIAKLQRFYGGGDLTSFPEFKFAEPKLDEVSQE